ncbi:MAG: hypothetical protein K9N09_11430 [Candidatus Cloacimonetes bacterium]|nr:hypothetical protein [Candidatus Cloacimonadota bacterium]MCF7869295.1 hypothetical protein [Candidatus Cloacimonadota bacterium]MCF7884717.1 hypothetical protein [Candidatus Cloacimonadota bacterium]
MRREVLYVLIVALVFLIIAFWYYQYQEANKMETKFEVLLATYSPLDTLGVAIEFAYRSLLEEEGIPFRIANREDIFLYQPQEIVSHNPVIIFPDQISQKIPIEYEIWISEYVQLGGNVFISYDSGIKMRNDRYREKAVFSPLLGINYITYTKHLEDSHRIAKLQFKDEESAKYFQIPYGKLDENLNVTGYAYGSLDFPVARIEVTNLDNDEIYAYSVHEDGSRSPNIIVKRFEKGSAIYTNLPLGFLKAYGSDELLLRMILRTYLFKVVKIPHLSNMPSNKGGLVMNWQVDNNKEWSSINWSEKRGFLRQDFPFSCHISAGPWLEEEGDNLGFDAYNHKGLVKKLSNYGEIGSLGGWAHNWFAIKILNNKFTTEDIDRHIKLNIEVLSNIINKPIREYSAPRGLHTPYMTRLLNQENIYSHYYVGDTGSQPNRAFLNGKRFSDKIFAFPIMPMQSLSNVHEFGIERISPTEYENWLNKTLEHLVENHLTTLISSHFYDFKEYPQYVAPFQRFMDNAVQLQNSGKLLVKPMSYFTEFWNRLLKTKIEYYVKENNLLISIENPEGLKDIVLCLPKEDYKRTAGVDLELSEDDDYYYIRFTENVENKLISVLFR